MAKIREKILSTFLLCALLTINYDTVLGQDEKVLKVAFLKTHGFKSRTLPANKGDHCVSYYARAWGKAQGKLETHLEDEAGKTIAASVHINYVDATERLFYFNVQEQKTPFKVVINKAADLAEEDSIALLDVEVTEGKCLDKTGSCNFESGTCGYSSNENGNTRLWSHISPNEEDADDDDDENERKFPDVDVSTGSGVGRYMRTHLRSTRDSAELTSPMIQGNISCVSFFYSLIGDGKLVVGRKASSDEFDTISNSETKVKTHRPGWTQKWVDVRVTDSDTYKITFTATSQGSDAWVAIDDVQVLHKACRHVEYSRPEEPEVPETIAEGSCDFDGACSDKWVPDENNQGYTWSLQTGKGTPGSPKFDHTNKDSSSKFQYVSVEKTTDERKIVLKGPYYSAPSGDFRQKCFSFWYFMHGPSVPRLSVQLKRPSLSLFTMWAREGDQGPAWRQAFVRTHYPGKKTASFQFEVTTTSTGSVAIDDVVAYDGPCPNSEAVCDFEYGNRCGFELGSWKIDAALNLERLTGLQTDQSTGTGRGSYVHMDTSKEEGESLISPMFPPTPGSCLKFYYHINGNVANTYAMRVYLNIEGGDSYTIERLAKVDQQGKWSFAEIDIYTGTHFQIMFTSLPNSGVISLDDIQLSGKPCSDSYGCDFEQGLCAWRPNRDGDSNLDWQITSGHLPDGDIGPHKDVTLNSEFGHYLFLQTSAPAQAGDVAVLTSQEMVLGRCLTFYYSMIGEGTGTLAVNLTYIREPDSAPKVIWSKTGSQGSSPEWKKAMTSFGDQRHNRGQLHFIGTVGNKAGADIAVDEIEIHYTNCANVKDDESLEITCKQSAKDKEEKKPKVQIKRSQVCNFIRDCPYGDDEVHCGSCTFSRGDDWCNYVDVSMGEASWKSSQDVRESHLAAIPKRNSYGMLDGSFLLLDRMPHRFAGRMLAELESNHYLGPSPPACQLHFSYFSSAFIPTQPTIRVLLRQSDEETVIFHNHGGWREKWLTATVDIGSIDSRFKIVFQGYKQFWQAGDNDVAIDDIQFRYCEFPPVVDSCKPSEFRCRRGSCVELVRVCDFNDDCGDRSDEENCDGHPVAARVSLEEGFGDWTLESSSEPWLIQNGESGQNSFAHPGRDHTLGTLAGHYMYRGHGGVKSARLTSPTLTTIPGKGLCHLRLYYFIMGSYNNQKLRVYIKTSQLGEKKLVFTRFTSHGQIWNRADVPIETESQRFQIVIEGTRGGYGTFLGLDDISVWNCQVAPVAELPVGTAVDKPSCRSGRFQCEADYVCIHTNKVCDFVNDCSDGSDEKHCGNCDFEADMCGWHDESLGVYSWVQQAARQLPQPFRDTTRDEDGEGHVLLLQTHSAGVDKSEAVLLSPLLPSTDPKCRLTFSYYTDVDKDYVTNQLLRVTAQTMDDAGSEVYHSIPRLEDVTIKPGGWTRLTYNLGISLGNRWGGIAIRHRYYPSRNDATIAIDDVKFENCKPLVSVKSIEETLEPLECSFREDFCQFYPSYLVGDYYWRLSRAYDRKGDFTQAAITGGWTRSNGKHTATLTSRWISATSTDLCVQFWYMTFGTTLKVKLRHEGFSGGQYRPLFGHRNYEMVWRMAHVQIPASEKPFLIEIEGVVVPRSEHLYLSDMTVTRGDCPRNPGSCDFEIDKCEFVVDKFQSWRRDSPVSGRTLIRPSADHTTGDIYGYFMHVWEKPELGKQTVSMTSPEFQLPESGGCIYFWYHMRGRDVGRLNVKLRRSGAAVDTPLWTMSGEKGDHWIQGRVDIPGGKGKFNLVVEAELTGGDTGSISVDDFTAKDGACPREGSCDFDSDMCGYTSHILNENSDMESDSRWIRLTGKHHLSIYGPKKDHTQRQLNGGFAFSDQFSFVFVDSEPVTRMVSPYMKSTERGCLSFWYYFWGTAEGSLRVLIGESTVFTVKSKSESWRYSRVIQHASDEPYQIIFESTRETAGRTRAAIAVDDVIVSDCEDHQTPAPPRPVVPGTRAPRPSLIPHLPVPDEKDRDHAIVTNCNAYCLHFRTCYVVGEHHVQCICREGYTGHVCESALPPDFTGQVEDPYDDDNEDKLDSSEEAKLAPRGGAKQGSQGWQAAVAAIVTILILAALLFAVFVFLVRTSRIRAPGPLQNLLPSLLSPPAQGGLSNPAFSYTPSADNGEGILNPVYETKDSKI